MNYSYLFVYLQESEMNTLSNVVSVKPHVPSWTLPNQGQFFRCLLISFLLIGMFFLKYNKLQLLLDKEPLYHDYAKNKKLKTQSNLQVETQDPGRSGWAFQTFLRQLTTNLSFLFEIYEAS